MAEEEWKRRVYEKYRTLSHGSAAAENLNVPYFRAKFLPLLEGISKDSRILEIGCGNGSFLSFLKAEGFNHVQGVDISEEQVAAARKRELDVIHADIFEFFRENKTRYKAITGLDVIEHLTKDQIFELMPLIYQALEKDGLLIVQTINGSGLFPRQVIYDDITHATVLTPGSLSQILICHGFSEISFFETGPAATNVKGVLRTLFWNLIKIFANVIRLVETGKSQRLWTENMICTCKK